MLMVPGRLPPPRPARSTRHPPMRSCSSLAAGESRTLHKTVSGEWCCLLASRGSRDHGTIFQHPSASIWTSKAIRLGCPRIKSSGTQAPLNPVDPARPIDPRLASRQRRSPPAPSASRSSRWLSQLRNPVHVWMYCSHGRIATKQGSLSVRTNFGLPKHSIASSNALCCSHVCKPFPGSAGIDFSPQMIKFAFP